MFLGHFEASELHQISRELSENSKEVLEMQKKTKILSEFLIFWIIFQDSLSFIR